MKRSLDYLSIVMVVALSSTVALACTAPSSSGVNICTPGATQAVSYPANITAAASAQSGHKITAIAMYINGSRVLLQHGSTVSETPSWLKSGTYRLTINAWDETGHVYSSHRSFTVTGACAPSSPGILFCSPSVGSWQPTNSIAGDVAARGANSPITRMQLFFDGLLVQDGPASSATFTGGVGNAGTHTLSAKAWDKAGHVYTASTKFTTYYDGICSPKGCAPGVFVQSPADGQSVKTTFPLRADVQGNAIPITAMRAYVDGQQVASSSGPTMIANVNAAGGQHVLVVQAWDTKGKLYRTVETITVE